MLTLYFSPIECRDSLLGGLLLGSSASLFYYLSGRIAGISGLLRGAVFSASPEDISFISGLALAGLLRAPTQVNASGDAALGTALVGGLLVGWGASTSSGCTSGHGVCGLGRASPRSLAAVATFMCTGAAAATLAGAVPALRAALAPAARLVPAPPLALAVLAAALAVRAAATPAATAAAAAAAQQQPPRSVVQLAGALLCGALFGSGLLLSGMCDPGAVTAFLNPAAPGGWNPRLAFVMGGGVAVTALAFRAFSAWTAPPLLDAPGSTRRLSSVPYGVSAPANLRIDARLLAGAGVFGLGWGLGGACPGPAIVTAASGAAVAHASLAGIVVGSWLAGGT